MYEQSGAGMTIPENNLSFIQNKPTKMMNGRQLRRHLTRIEEVWREKN